MQELTERQDNQVAVSLEGKALSCFGWTMLAVLMSVLIIPAAWGYRLFFRWLVRNFVFSDDTKATFEGPGGQIWGSFAMYMFIALLPQILITLIPELAELNYDNPWLPLVFGWLLLPLSTIFSIRIFRWFFSSIKLSTGTTLAFKGSYKGLLGWLLLNAVSIITIIGWAWVTVAFTRWICRNLESGDCRVVFTGSGWGYLWRVLVMVLASAFIIPFPWVLIWLIRWFASHLVVEKAAA